MEIYLGAGLEEEIRANRTGDQKSGYIARMKNLETSQSSHLRGLNVALSLIGELIAARD